MCSLRLFLVGLQTCQTKRPGAASWKFCSFVPFPSKHVRCIYKQSSWPIMHRTRSKPLFRLIPANPPPGLYRDSSGIREIICLSHAERMWMFAMPFSRLCTNTATLGTRTEVKLTIVISLSATHSTQPWPKVTPVLSQGGSSERLGRVRCSKSPPYSLGIVAPDFNIPSIPSRSPKPRQPSQRSLHRLLGAEFGNVAHFHGVETALLKQSRNYLLHGCPW